MRQCVNTFFVTQLLNIGALSTKILICAIRKEPTGVRGEGGEDFSAYTAFSLHSVRAWSGELKSAGPSSASE